MNFFFVAIGREDVTELLLGEKAGGLDNLVREVEDYNFTPVASSIEVKLSDQGGTVSNILGLPSLDSPATGSIKKGNVVPVTIHAARGSGLSLYYRGNIDLPSIRRNIVTADNLNNQDIVSFTVFDETKVALQAWDKIQANGLGSFPTSEAFLSGKRLANFRDWLSFILAEASLNSGGPGINNVVVSDSFRYLYVDAFAFKTVYDKQVAAQAVQTVGSLLIDLAKSRLAVLYVLDGVLFFTHRLDFSIGASEISDLSFAEVEPVQVFSPEYVRDIRPEMLFVMENGQGLPIGGKTVAWYYIDKSGVEQKIIGDKTQPVGNIYDAVPSYAVWMNNFLYASFYEWKYPSVQPDPAVISGFKYADQDELRRSVIEYMLNPPPAFHLKAPDDNFFPLQKITVGGVSGYRIKSCRISPMARKSTLVVEYLGN